MEEFKGHTSRTDVPTEKQQSFENECLIFGVVQFGLAAFDGTAGRDRTDRIPGSGADAPADLHEDLHHLQTRSGREVKSD